MVARGTVRGGVVVFEGTNGLREGDQVAVISLVPPAQELRPAIGSNHSILDIPTFSLGGILKPFSPDDDLLGEMLDERP